MKPTVPESDVSPDVSPLTARHIDQVIAIENDIYPFPWSISNFEDSLRAGYDAWRLAHCDHRQAGATIGYAIVMHALDEAHLLNLSIARPFQGNGHGRWFLHWLMRSARTCGAVGMFLEVRPSNEAALQLYEAESFVRIGTRPGYYPSYDGDRENAIVMRRALTDIAEPRIRVSNGR